MRLKDYLVILFCLATAVAIGQNKNNPYPVFKPISQELGKEPILDCDLKVDKDGIQYHKGDKLLEYTHPDLKRFMVDKELIEIYASVSKAGGQYFIDMNYIFNSSKGIENYGSHGQGAPIKVFLLNKESLYFKNIKSSRPRVNMSESVSFFNASYLLDDYEIKQLLKSPILRMEVSYQYGAESYEVANITLIRDQLQCLKNTEL